MWSCIWPPACSVVYCRRREDLVPTLTAPEPLHSIHTHQDKTGRGMHTACTLLQYFGKTLHCSLFSSIYQRVYVGLCACMCVCMYACVHVCVNCTHRCQVMTSHLLIPCCFYYPLSIPFHLCALSLWMTAWLQSPSVPQPNLSNLVVSKVWCDNSSRSAQTPTRCSVNIRQMDVLMLIVRVLCAISE